jgi:D-alanyl-D-alanine dipeptidase
MLRPCHVFVVLLLLAASAKSQDQGGDLELLGLSQQMVVVTSSDWKSTTGFLRRFERTDNGWQMDGPVLPIVLGRGGLGWGRGAQPPSQPGPQKREGDGRSPAGIFPLTYAFGYADPDSVREIKLPYVQCTSTLECVDDTNSSYYNIIVDRRTVSKPDWKSSEKMHMTNDEYRLGIFVANNSEPAKPGYGSCVFMHIWKSPQTPTSGCTAMSPGAIESLLGWLDARNHPVLVQFPEAEYQRVQKAWRLPDLVNTNL